MESWIADRDRRKRLCGIRKLDPTYLNKQSSAVTEGRQAVYLIGAATVMLLWTFRQDPNR
jgi:hypothetical protein